MNSPTLYPAKCRVRDETPNLKAEDVIMCCVVTAVAHLGAVTDEYGAVME
jgi:hypothetical protein